MARVPLLRRQYLPHASDDSNLDLCEEQGCALRQHVRRQPHSCCQIAGANVEMIQKTEYPWHGSVSITVNPKEPKTFSVFVRIPNRTTSKLYKQSPAIQGVKRFAVNGQEHTPKIERGYAVVTREWKPATGSKWNSPWSHSACSPTSASRPMSIWSLCNTGLWCTTLRRQTTGTSIAGWATPPQGRVEAGLARRRHGNRG